MTGRVLRCHCGQQGVRTPAALRGLRRLPFTAAPGPPGEASSWHILCGGSAGARARLLGAIGTHRHRSRLVATARSSGEASEGGSGQGKLQRGGQLGGRLGALLRDIPARGRGLLLLNLLVRPDSSCLWWQVVLCATNMVVIKGSEATFDAFAFSLGRFCIAALAFTPFLAEGLADEALWAPAVELGLWMGLGYLTQAQGLLTVDASRAAFISTLTVVVVPILAGLSGKGVRALTWASALGATLGCALLGTGNGAGFGVGDLLSVLSAVFFGIQVFRTEAIAHKLQPGKQLPLMALSLSSVAALMLVTSAFAHPQELQRVLSAPASAAAALGHLRDQGVPWWQMLYTGVLSTDAVLLIEVFALNDVPSTDAAIIYSMEPVLGAGLAWAVLGERWGAWGWVGAALILVSSLSAQIFGSSCAEK